MGNASLILKEVDGALANIKITKVEEYLKLDDDTVNTAIRKLTNLDRFLCYEMGCFLYTVFTKELWKRPEFCLRAARPTSTMPTYKGFQYWVENELQISDRKARYLKSAAQKLHELNVDPETIRELYCLGWPKVYQILRVSKDTEDVIRWMEVAKATTVDEMKNVGRLASRMDPEMVRKGEKKGEIVEGKLSQTMNLDMRITRAANFALYKRSLAKLQRRSGKQLSNEDFLGLVCAHFLTTTLPGEGLEIASEVEFKIREFTDSIQHQYGVDLMVVVRNDDGDEEKDPAVELVAREAIYTVDGGGPKADGNGDDRSVEKE